MSYFSVAATRAVRDHCHGALMVWNHSIGKDLAHSRDSSPRTLSLGSPIWGESGYQTILSQAQKQQEQKSFSDSSRQSYCLGEMEILGWGVTQTLSFLVLWLRQDTESHCLASVHNGLKVTWTYAEFWNYKAMDLWIMDVHETKKHRDPAVYESQPRTHPGFGHNSLFSSLLSPSNIVKPKFNKMDSTKCNSISQIWVRGYCLRKMGTLKVDIAEINLSSLAFNCVISEKFYNH